MAHVVVLGTGGTIASTKGDDGASTAQLGADELLSGRGESDLGVEFKDVFRLGSYLLEQRHLREIAEAAAHELARTDVCGVVITHGTDTMEETAYLLDLVHNSDKPVVFTGAQRPFDAPDSDGPRNLTDAMLVAADKASTGKGAMISFAGNIYAARATRKTHTISPSPFETLEGGPIGHIIDDTVRFNSAPIRPQPIALPSTKFDDTKVDIVFLYPGADASLAEAAVRSGARAIVIAGSGVGNGNTAITNWARGAVKAGIIVALGSRVAEGPVVPAYGNGGGADLVRAGAIPLGTLPVFQARILIALLLSTDTIFHDENIVQYL